MSGAARALRHRGFAAFFTAASISNAASWMQLVAVPALLFELTGKGSWLGISSMVTLVPAVLLTPYAGVLADRVSRRTILLITQTTQMAAAFSLWALYVAGLATPIRIVAIGLVTGIAAGFQTSAWQSFVPSLVPPEDLLDAVRLNSVQFTVARFVGPALAGLVVTTAGVGAAIFCNAITYPLVIGVLIVVQARPNATAAQRAPVGRALADGARYVWHHRPVRLAVGLALVSSLLGQSLQYVAAAVSADVFGRPPTDNAALLTALGAGALVASVAMAAIGGRVPRSRQVVVALSLYVAGIALAPLTTRFPVGVVAYFLMGLAHLTMAVALNTLVQGTVTDEMRGRALSFYLLGILAGIPLGALVIGVLSDVVSMRAVLAVDALAFLGVLALLVSSGRVRLLDESGTPDGSPLSARTLAP